MARLKHTLILDPTLSRDELTRAVAVPFDVWESLRAEGHRLRAEDGRAVQGVALVAGEHASPGAVYGRDEETAAPLAKDAIAPRVTLVEWDRAGGVALRVDGQRLGPGPSPRLAADLRLRGVERPERATLRVDGSVSRPGRQRRRWLRWFTLQAELDVARWYASAAGTAGRAPLRVRVRHSLVGGEFGVTPRPAAGGAWEVEVLVNARGRGVLRPVVAVPLLVAKRILRRSLDRNLPRAAEFWRDRLRPELVRDPAESRRLLVDELCTPFEERSRGPAAEG
ncbi:hypothetical protein FH609_017325 [Streptomyces sp. 3MP-14]|uniref:Uncharacterized protein n=1 Tax=Streptomyces mimosae TaxID=2586635 RepID=A0A5N6ABB1_9ACTN|nr:MULTISPECIES: hypothetical protein [Streptomyces]KAB8165323.1 hypothetical protein FH607_014650 [Streptomyces mimosae]KAB8175955.1 hypothetical protein FH609_017325 [Streptomyces sp. 3MP-14]